MNLINSQTNRMIYMLYCLLVAIFLAALISYIPINSKKLQLIEMAKQQKMDLEINGEVYLNFLPMPHLQANNVIIKKNSQILLEAQSIAVGLSIIDLLSNKTTFSKLSLNKPIIHNSILFNQAINNTTNELPLLTKLSIKNGKLIDSLIENISGNIYREKNSLSGEVSFIMANQRITAIFDLYDYQKNKRPSAISFTSKEGLAINLDLQAKNISTAPEITGSINATFPNLGIINETLNILSKDGSQYNLQDGDIKLEGRFNYSDSAIKLDDLSLSSSNITAAKGNAIIGIGDLADTDIKFSIKSLNLLNFLDEEIKENNFKLAQKFISKLLTPPDLLMPKNLAANIEIKIDKVLMQGHELQEVNFISDAWGGNIYLNDFSFKSTPRSKFKLEGILSHNNIRPKFAGNMLFIADNPSEIAGMLNSQNLKFTADDKINFKSDIFIIPNKVTLTNIDGNLWNTGLKGDLFFLHEPRDIVAINSSIKAVNLDLDKFDCKEFLDQLIYSFYRTDSDKTGRLHFTAVDDYKWFRNFGLYFNWISKLEIEDLTYNKHKFKKSLLQSKIKRGVFAVPALHLQSELIDIEADIELLLQSFRPIINVNANINYLDAKVTEILPSNASLKATLIRDITKQIQEQQKADSKQVEQQESIPDFNFFSANNYDGEIVVTANNITLENGEINNFKAKVNLSNGNIILNQFEGDMYQGKFFIIGAITIMSAVPSMVFDFSLENMNPEPLFAYVTKLPGYMTGYLNVRGHAEADGNNWRDVFNKMVGSAEFAGKKIIVKGLDIGEIVNSVDLQLTPEAKLEHLEYYSRNGSSFFSDIKGGLSLKNGLLKIINMHLSNNRVQGALSTNFNIFSRTASGIAQFGFIPIKQNIVLNTSSTFSGEVGALNVSINNDQIINYIKATTPTPPNNAKEDRYIN